MDYLIYAVDWTDQFRPAVLLLLSGRSPYLHPGFYNPPWALLPLIPLALLPGAVGRILLLLLCLGLFAWTAVRLGARWPALVVFLLSPPVLVSLWAGNLDALALLGAVLPPWLGLLFVSIKPQIGVGIGLYWLFDAWRSGGPGLVARRFLPVSIAFTLSVALFGPWPFHSRGLITHPLNASLWPFSISVGLALLVWSLRKRKPTAALAAGPPLSPYLMIQSWCASLAALLHHPFVLLAAVVGLWMLLPFLILNPPG